MRLLRLLQKMKTRRFSIFCVRCEMVVDLGHYFREKGFNIAFYVEGMVGSVLAKTSLDDFIAGDGDVRWLSNENKDPSSFLGLVKIAMPKFVEGDLCLASVAIKTDDSIDAKANLQLYRNLVESFKRKYRAGVWGVNKQYGGEAYYKDIYISDGAIAEAAKGVELAPEGGGGFVRFEWRSKGRNQS